MANGTIVYGVLRVVSARKKLVLPITCSEPNCRGSALEHLYRHVARAGDDLAYLVGDRYVLGLCSEFLCWLADCRHRDVRRFERRYAREIRDIERASGGAVELSAPGDRVHTVFTTLEPVTADAIRAHFVQAAEMIRRLTGGSLG